MRQISVFEYLKQTLKGSGVTGKLLLVNLIVFLFFLVLRLIEYLFVKDELVLTVLLQVAAPGDPAALLYTPWSVITSMFTHYEFGHFFFNMLMLFLVSIVFLQYFGEKRLLSTYILGGIFAYLFHIGAYYIFPVFAQQTSGLILGASGAIMAVFGAVAFYRPSHKVLLYGVISIPLILIAGLYIIADLSGITETTGAGEGRIAHFAHLGGLVFGAVSILGADSPKHFMIKVDRFFSWFKLPAFSFKRKPKMKVYHNPSQTRNMTDEEFNYNKKLREERLDAILDKIRKKGYEGLSQEEKDFLFNESQRK